MATLSGLLTYVLENVFIGDFDRPIDMYFERNFERYDIIPVSHSLIGREREREREREITFFYRKIF